jgi:hypothetical protein
LALVADRKRVVSIAAFGRAERDGYRLIAVGMPESGALEFLSEQHPGGKLALIPE